MASPASNTFSFGTHQILLGHFGSYGMSREQQAVIKLISTHSLPHVELHCGSAAKAKEVVQQLVKSGITKESSRLSSVASMHSIEDSEEIQNTHLRFFRIFSDRIEKVTSSGASLSTPEEMNKYFSDSLSKKFQTTPDIQKVAEQFRFLDGL